MKSIVAIAMVLFVGAQAHAFKNPIPLGASDLLGMVTIEFDVDGNGTKEEVCGGMLIDSRTVVTAAHCVCTEHWVGGNVCGSDVNVSFRDDPALPGFYREKISSRVRIHPDYNPTLLLYQSEHDIAVVELEELVAPPFAKPFIVSDGFLDEGDLALLAGRGNTGSSCAGEGGPFNYISAPVYEHEDGHDIVTFDGELTCGGDSGGAVLGPEGNWLFGVIASHYNDETKATTTGRHFDWIKSHMCTSSPWNQCTGEGYVCNCTAGTNVLWRKSSGQVELWSVDGDTVTARTIPGTPGQPGWEIQGTGDFDGDGQFDDIFWRHANGNTAIWFLVNGQLTAQAYPGNPGGIWRFHGVGDFDGDGRSDVLWRDDVGQLGFWFGGESGASGDPDDDLIWKERAGMDLAWQVIGVGDADGDAHSDIFWRHTDGGMVIWFMNGETRVGESPPRSINRQYAVQAIGDFDGNQRADVLWRDTVNGQLQIWFDGNASSGAYPSFGNVRPDGAGFDYAWWEVQGVGDFDHDGRDDILWRHVDGQLAIWLLDGRRFVGELRPDWMDASATIEGMPRPGIASVNRAASYTGDHGPLDREVESDPDPNDPIAFEMPEPGALASLGSAIALLAVLRRRREA